MKINCSKTQSFTDRFSSNRFIDRVSKIEEGFLCRMGYFGPLVSLYVRTRVRKDVVKLEGAEMAHIRTMADEGMGNEFFDNLIQTKSAYHRFKLFVPVVVLYARMREE